MEALFKKIALIIFGIVLSLFILEIFLRLGSFLFFFIQDFSNMNGLEKRGAYRILCIGESTTADIGQGSYAQYLQERLDSSGRKFTVMNKGIPAVNSAVILKQLEYNLDKYKPDMVITMIGINDNRSPLLESRKLDFNKVFSRFRLYKLFQFAAEGICNKLLVYKAEHNMDFLDKSDNYYFNLGQKYRYNCLYDEAELFFEKAIQQDPDNEEIYIELGRLYRMRGPDYKASEDKLKKAIAINPDNSGAYRQLGATYMRLGRADLAREMLIKSLQAMPNDYWAGLKLAVMYIDESEYEKAQELLIKIKNAYPYQPQSYNILSILYEKISEPDLAKECYLNSQKWQIAGLSQETVVNYNAIKDIILSRNIKLVCMQYALRNIEALKNVFYNQDDIVFIDNDSIFRKAVVEGSYSEYFSDIIAGDFGHCTVKGNQLMARSIAAVCGVKHYK